MDRTSLRRPLARTTAVIAVACAAVAALAGAAGRASPDGARGPAAPVLYVANTSSRPGTVTPISTATNTAGKPIRAGGTPSAMVVTPDGRTIYVGNYSPGTVTPISAVTNTVGRPIKIGSIPY